MKEMSSNASHLKQSKSRKSKLWLFIWLAFALQITAWVFWVKLASKHPVQEVPLVTAQPTENLSSGRVANEPPAQDNHNPDAAAQSATAAPRQ